MKFEFSKELAKRMAKMEDGHHVGAGSLALKMYQHMGLLPVDEEKEKKDQKTVKNIV